MSSHVPEPIDAKALRSITMEAQQWQNVVIALHEIPYRIAKPLIDAIVEQCSEPRQKLHPAQRPNGDTPPVGWPDR